MDLRIGIPRALWYYSHYPFWRTYFENLGAQVVVSPPTSRDIINAGITDTVSEACVPIKVYFGHVRALVQSWENKEIDAIFLPRYVNWSGPTTYCPKFLGLPDMVRYSFARLPQLIETRIDRRRPLGLFLACNQIRRQLGASVSTFLRAYNQAVINQRLHEKRLKQGWNPVDAISGRRSRVCPISNPPVRLALLGYPYLIYDYYINLGLYEKLHAAGVEVLTAEAVPLRFLKRQTTLFRKRLFWTYSDLVARAGYFYLKHGPFRVDGIIHVTAFGCGPDAMVDKLLELRSRLAELPFLPVSLDEQSGEAGIVTRIEAFVDMLRRRRQIACQR